MTIHSKAPPASCGCCCRSASTTVPSPPGPPPLKVTHSSSWPLIIRSEYSASLTMNTDGYCGRELD
ncbi:hypothetical protein E2C01_033211 [Portunus trituberculatus]|uniref:Uncharacterized protein n=1 Tax=Portunus trituberculatus TaxID=210409 RepID=A0A5B7F2E3_PORTR|nr:hypothetical protein [Portunus trituberculatus]